MALELILTVLVLRDRPWGQLWGESLGRILIGVEAQHEAEVVDRLEEYGLTLMGLVTSNSQLVIEDGFDEIVNIDITDLEKHGKELNSMR